MTETYQTKFQVEAADVAIHFNNSNLPAVHKALRGRPALAAQAALCFETERASHRFLAYLAGNPSIFDKGA